MNIDDYMDMQHDLAEADVIAFENEIDYLHKELEVYKCALSLTCFVIASFPDIPRCFSANPRAQEIEIDVLAAVRDAFENGKSDKVNFDDALENFSEESKNE